MRDLLLFVPFLVGCEASVEPLPATGHVVVERALPADLDPQDVVAVEVGGVPAYDLAALDGAVRFTVQGGEPGEAAVVARTAKGARTLDPVTYGPPVDPLFARMAAFGASYTMGVQSSRIDVRTQLHSPAQQLARAAGAWLPSPLIEADLIAGTDLDAIGPTPDCAIPFQGPILQNGILSAFATLGERGTGFRGARLSPDLQVRNVAIGNYRLQDVLRGTIPADVDRSLLTYLAFPGDAEAVGDPLGPTQVERLESLEPTLIVSMDLLGNAVLGTAVRGAEASVEDLPSVATVRADLIALFDRLDALGAEVFLANLPRLSVIPRVTTSDLPADVLAAIEERSEAYNDLLTELSAGTEHIHIVDFAGFVTTIETTGLPVGDTVLDGSPLGGLASFDGTHLSDTGYASIAQLFAEAITDTLGVDVPAIDLEDVLDDDPFGPPAVRARGREPDDCR